ncbi:MAG: DUF1428 domain-containing protein [Geminicoccaceae bacterium]|nr:DUF1428 domain-containing protein [Geminicoccaceae bacterium]
MSYIQGFVVPVPRANKDAYRDLAAKAAPMFREYGATRLIECWGVDLAEGETTDFRKAVRAEESETVVFAWIEWPDRATCDAAARRMEADERWKSLPAMPFDGKRMFWGGFEPLFDSDDRSAATEEKPGS